MGRRRIVSALIVIVFFQSILSCHTDEHELKQEPIEEATAFWTINYCGFSLANTLALVKVGAFGDTIFNGKTYHKLYAQVNYKVDAISCNDCDFNFDRSKAKYFISYREEDNRVYYVPYTPIGLDPPGTEYLVFDYNISNVGDEVSVYPYFFTPSDESPDWGGFASDGPVTYTVSEINEVQMSDGSVRKVFTFDDAIIESWIERIGSSIGFNSFNHIYGRADHLMAFSSNGVHLLDIKDKVVSMSGDCGISPITYELTTAN